MTYSIRIQLYKDGKALGAQNYALLKTNSARYAETFLNELVDVANSGEFAERVAAETNETADDRNSRALRKARGAL